MQRVHLIDLEHLYRFSTITDEEIDGIIRDFISTVFGAPEPDRTPRSISEALFSRSAAFLSFLDLHSWRKRSMHTVTLHLKQNGGGQRAGIL